MTIKLSHAEGGEADSQRTRRATSRTLCTRSVAVPCTATVESFQTWGETAPKAKPTISGRTVTSTGTYRLQPVLTGGAVNHSSIMTVLCRLQIKSGQVNAS